jgi:AraC-like DNA-binding protein
MRWLFSGATQQKSTRRTLMRTLQNDSSVEEGDSFEHWHQVTCRNYSVSEFQRDSDDLFGAQISIRAFGALLLTDASSSSIGAARLVRGPTEIRKDPCDHFMLYLVTEGELGIVQDGREVRAHAGDLFLYDQTSPFTLEFEQRYHTIMLKIPRPLLESRVIRAQALTARRIAGESKLGALAGTIIRQLVGFDENVSAEIIDRLAASALDIVSVALAAEIDKALPRAGPHRLLEQVEKYLLVNLHDPELNIEAIASAQGIAPRTLNRIFAAEGTTPMRWLWQQRLGASYSALAEGRIRNVTDAALSFGFSNVSHFSRTFKTAFGKSPLALIRR